MKNILNKYYLAFMAVILFGSVYSQTQVSGSVMDADNMEPIPGVNVIIDGTTSELSQISMEILSLIQVKMPL